MTSPGVSPWVAPDLEELRRTGRAGELVRLEHDAARAETRHFHGPMAWRRWGEGPPVLLFHGGSGSWNHWLRAIPALSQNHCVWVPDLPGMGESACPTTPLSIEDYCALVGEGFEQLVSDDDLFDLVTFSMGGEFAVPFAKLFPERLRRLVMVGSNIATPLTRDQIPLRDYRKVACPQHRDEIIRENFITVMLHDEAAIDELALAMQYENLRRRRIGSTGLTNRRSLCEVVRELPAGIGLHIINGTRDVVLNGRLEEQAAALARIRPQGRFRAIDLGSHWIMYDKAEAFNRCVLEFLSG